MPGFDFSNSTLETWTNPLSEYWTIYINSAVWDAGGQLTINTISLKNTSISELHLERYWYRWRMFCEPVFAVLMANEAFALSLWKRAEDTLLKGHQLIIRDSDWVVSFKKNEWYGDTWEEGEAVHYVLCADNDFAHVISKNEPQWEDMGTDKFAP